MLEDVRREPYCFGGHEYKLFSGLGDETGEKREARIDREELALNGSCLTLGMVRELANASPPTDGDSGELDPTVEQCVDECRPSANPSCVNGGQPLAYKLRTRACARVVGEKTNIRPIEIARAGRARRALANASPGPTYGEDERRPLSNSPGVRGGKPLLHKVGAMVGALAAQ
jgi:hypothetical protein